MLRRKAGHGGSAGFFPIYFRVIGRPSDTLRRLFSIVHGARSFVLAHARTCASRTPAPAHTPHCIVVLFACASSVRTTPRFSRRRHTLESLATNIASCAVSGSDLDRSSSNAFLSSFFMRAHYTNRSNSKVNLPLGLLLTIFDFHSPDGE